MASNMPAEEADEATLSTIFKSLWATYLMIENTEESTGSDKIQGELRKALGKAEQAIFMVNALKLFSDNEDIDEVATNEVRYMLLPALLGYFHSINTHAGRMETVLKAKNHYRDFLRMVKSYSVSSQHIPLDVEDDEEPSNQVTLTSAPARQGPDLVAMASQRNSKIERFRQNKQFDSRLKDLSEAVEKDTVDDEVKREFYLTQVKRWINTALDELTSLNSEVQILQMMAEQKKAGGNQNNNAQSSDRLAGKPSQKSFRPFILTKDAVQKKVYGLGYPGVPTMSIEEFYQQKVEDGTFSIPSCHQPASGSLQGRAENPELARQEEDEEQAGIEKREEGDDPDLLQKTRGMDDFKDDHRRGWGNRQNMG